MAMHVVSAPTVLHLSVAHFKLFVSHALQP